MTKLSVTILAFALCLALANALPTRKEVDAQAKLDDLLVKLNWLDEMSGLIKEGVKGVVDVGKEITKAVTDGEKETLEGLNGVAKQAKEYTHQIIDGVGKSGADLVKAGKDIQDAVNEDGDSQV